MREGISGSYHGTGNAVAPRGTAERDGGMSGIRKVVFPVAGLGTRMLPATKVLPKEMLPVVDRPIVEYAVQEAAAAGCEVFVFVTGRGKSLIEDHFDRAFELFETLARKGKTRELEALEAALPDPGSIVYTRQQAPLGLGHAVWCARNIVGDEPFGVILVDDLVHARTPCLAQLAAVHAETGGANVVAVEEVPSEHTSRYGILDPAEDDGRRVRVRAFVEKPKPEEAPSRLAVIGRYILSPRIFSILEDLPPGAGGEIQLTDAMTRLLEHEPFYGVRFEGRRFDCGDRVGYLEANLALAMERPDIAARLHAFLRHYV
ncbi:UTP--glucose-1-phosphate uridylyltransferase [bacterium HR39]|nr:UTP--glucose-1-phosphate uridylyltransferase [bacterium HR39]